MTNQWEQFWKFLKKLNQKQLKRLRQKLNLLAKHKKKSLQLQILITKSMSKLKILGILIGKIHIITMYIWKNIGSIKKKEEKSPRNILIWLKLNNKKNFMQLKPRKQNKRQKLLERDAKLISMKFWEMNQ